MTIILYQGFSFNFPLFFGILAFAPSGHPLPPTPSIQVSERSLIFELYFYEERLTKKNLFVAQKCTIVGQEAGL